MASVKIPKKFEGGTAQLLPKATEDALADSFGVTFRSVEKVGQLT